MRLYLKLSPSREIVPFNHINILTGALHKWLGENDEHDGLSLYSFSWLQGSETVPGKGFRFPRGADWFISSIHGDFLRRNIEGIFAKPDIRWGMRVEEVTMRVPPNFQDGIQEQRLLLASPVFCKQKLENGQERHYLYTDPETNDILTNNMSYKMKKCNIDPTGMSLRFDKNYMKANTKKVNYAEKYEYRASLCPLFMRGTPEQLAFAWSVGIGQATGLGFGAVV